jgi:4'-phosphopantetheinyl transferase
MNTPPEPEWEKRWSGVHVRVFGIGDNAQLSLEDAAAVLRDDEKERAARFHFEADQERWMRSRALLKLVLADEWGQTNARELEFALGEFGKPALGNGGPHFNLSHSGDFAAVAVGSQPVGVDVECRKELPVEELAAFAFRPEEQAAILAHVEPWRHFLALWTAKEAVMKCTGQGMSLPPAEIAVGLSGAGIPGSATTNGGERAFSLYSACDPGSWVLAVAIQAEA